jgi:hypothetical protein
MAAGLQPTITSVNQTAGDIAIAWRDVAQQTVQFQLWLNSVGAPGLEAPPIGISAADAAVIISTIGNLYTLAQAYAGLATISPAFNFESNSVALWGGS